MELTAFIALQASKLASSERFIRRMWRFYPAIRLNLHHVAWRCMGAAKMFRKKAG